MYQGRFQNEKPVRTSRRGRRRLRWSKQFAVLACICVLLMGFVGTTLAWLTDTDSVENKFTPAYVSCDATCTTVTNTSNIPAYIRIAVIPENHDGKKLTEGMGVVTGQNWVISGNYYIYTQPVNPNQQVAFTVDLKAPYHVLAEAIQAEPENAVSEAWNWSPSNTNG